MEAWRGFGVEAEEMRICWWEVEAREGAGFLEAREGAGVWWVEWGRVEGWVIGRGEEVLSVGWERVVDVILMDGEGL